MAIKNSIKNFLFVDFRNSSTTSNYILGLGFGILIGGLIASQDKVPSLNFIVGFTIILLAVGVAYQHQKSAKR